MIIQNLIKSKQKLTVNFELFKGGCSDEMIRWDFATERACAVREETMIHLVIIDVSPVDNSKTHSLDYDWTEIGHYDNWTLFIE